MGGGRGRLRAAAVALRAVAIMAAAGVVGGVAGCAAPPAPGPSVPQFPAPAAVSSTAAQPHHDGIIPDDCPALLAVDALGALLGLPLDSVAVRTTIGVPLPRSGRTERVDCAYTGNGGPARGQSLLSLAATGFRDRESARAQWAINVDATDGTRKDLPIGAASAVLFTRRGEAELAILYGSSNLTLVLPDRPLPGGRSREDLIVDLALRVLPTLADAGAAPPPPLVTPPPPPSPPPPLTNPPNAAGS